MYLKLPFLDGVTGILKKVNLQKKNLKLKVISSFGLNLSFIYLFLLFQDLGSYGKNNPCLLQLYINKYLYFPHCLILKKI